MQTIHKLANGLRIAVIGNCYDIIFDDNTRLKYWEGDAPEFSFVLTSPESVVINGIHATFSNGYLELNDWVKKDIDKLAEKYNNKFIDIIICNISTILSVYEYMLLNYPNIPICLPNVFDFDGDVPIAKIDSFYQYNPILFKL